MLQLFRPQPLPIGVDVGSESVKILQLALRPSGPAVAAAVRARIPDDVRGDPDARVVFAGETLRNALRRGGFHGRRIVASLPRELVHYKAHRLPPMPAGDLVMAARIDARDLFRFDPDSADVQCLDAGEVRQGDDGRREVILVAAGKKYIDDFVRALHRAGGRVASLEVEPCALRRSAQRVAAAASAAADDRPPQVLLDIGSVQSRIVICKGECIRLVKLVDVGADHLREAVSRKLGVPPAEAEQLRRRANANAASAKPADGVRQVIHDATRHAVETLAREVLASVRYHAATFDDIAPRRIDLLGGAADDPQVRSIVSATLSMPAEPLSLFAGIDAAAIPSADRTPSLGEWAVALGLALKGVPPFPAPPQAATAAGARPLPNASDDAREDADVLATAAAFTGATHD